MPRTRIALAAAALALAAAGTAPATEPNDANWTGKCGILAYSEPTYRIGTAYSYEGEVHAALALWSETPEHNPVSATVTCTVNVNGLPQVSIPGTGSGYVALHGRVQYSAGPDDVVDLCTTVDTTDPHGQKKWTITCAPVEGSRMPSESVTDLKQEAAHLVVNPAACGVLQSLFPFEYDGLRVGFDGDVYVSAARVWDCPPYDQGGTANVYLHVIAP